MLDAWRSRIRRDGELLDMTDRENWKNVRAPDGSLFFDISPARTNEDKLCIGVAVGFDA